MLISILLLCLGFAALIIGANWLVGGASSLAKRLGISELVIGLTIVAFGTSAPELVVNILASKNGLDDVILGNVVGSNIFNLLLILGVSGIILPIVVQHKTVWREIPISLFAIVILLFMANFLPSGNSLIIGRLEGVFLLIFFVAFLIYIFKNMSAEPESVVNTGQKSLAISIVLLVSGLAGLIMGGSLVVNKSIEIATSMGMSEKLIGLTIVSIGTSLPELATSVVAAFKKNSDLAIGNVIGSNIFNILLILGICATMNPITYNNTMNTDLFIMSTFTFLLFIAMFTGKKRKLDRWEAMIFVLSFTGYLIFVINRN
jgi:cation:H+ antiporter